jgi:hypothetical protein
MAKSMADLVGVVAYPSIFDLDRALEPGKKATGAGTALVTGRVVELTNSTGLWAKGTSGGTGRAGVVPKLYWGKNVNTDASANVVILTGEGAEVYVELGNTVKPGARVTFGDNGTAKIWTSGKVIGHYLGHYGEASGTGEPPTDGLVGEAGRIKLSVDQ